MIHVKAKGNVSLYFVKNVKNFSDIRTLIGWWRLYAMESCLRLRSPPQAGLESGTARSAGHRLTELPGLLSGETEDGSI